MAFNFYTGDNYFQSVASSFWDDVLINCIGAFVGFTLSLLIYRHQIRRDNKKIEEGRQETYKGQLIYFATVAETFVNDAKRQIILMNDYIKEQNTEPTVLKSLKKVPTYDFTRLLNNDNKDVLEAWMKNVNEESNISEYRKATSSIDKVEATVQEMHRVYNRRIEVNYSRLYEVKGLVDNLPDRLASIALELHIQLADRRFEDPFYKMIDAKIRLYTELIERNGTIKDFIEELVQPTVKEFLTNYKSNKHTDEIVTLCKKARVKFHEAEQDMKDFLVELNNFNNNIGPFILTIDNFVAKVKTFTSSTPQKPQ